MHMEHRLVQNQSQRLMLTQKMQQALQILQYSGTELEQYVQQELETNPLLDRQQIPTEPLATNTSLQPNGAATKSTGSDGATYDDGFDMDEFLGKWGQRFKEGRDFSTNRDLSDRRDFYANSVSKPESLSHHLVAQLGIFGLESKRLAIGERIVGEIDDRGYFTGSIDEIAADFHVTPDEVERVLYVVQRFEPTGVGARDVQECLLLQINVEYPDCDELRRLVEHHLDDLQNRQIPKIAKAMGIEPVHVEELKALLATLDPWPGRRFESEPTQYVTPDLTVEKIDDDWVVRLSNESVPELSINEDYRKLTRDKSIARDEKEYIRDKLRSAQWLIRNIDQRQQTILRIGTAIMEVQREFLEKGVEKLRPLTLQEIADMVGVHEATVSRTTRGKYMQTPQGLFELKYFFSPAIPKKEGQDQSSKSVQSMIKKIIEGEDKQKPLSDQAIADMLNKQGLEIARRTVTKYRKTLRVPSTTKRRQYAA
ncbi:MAG: RNA polymerase factor sigma-54 [Candidatus Hydrogenedentota bacterium]